MDLMFMWNNACVDHIFHLLTHGTVYSNVVFTHSKIVHVNKQY